jgi:hypothetical protein
VHYRVPPATWRRSRTSFTDTRRKMISRTTRILHPPLRRGTLSLLVNMDASLIAVQSTTSSLRPDAWRRAAPWAQYSARAAPLQHQDYQWSPIHGSSSACRFFRPSRTRCAWQARAYWHRWPHWFFDYHTKRPPLKRPPLKRPSQ